MSKFLFLGYQIALDFVNTEVMRNGERADLLQSAEDLAAWGQEAGLLSGQEAGAVGSVKGRAAEDLLRRGRAFRGQLRNMAAALAENRNVPASVLAALNEILRNFPQYLEVRHGREGYLLEARNREFTPQHLLGRLAKSAAELVANGKAGAVKRCGNPDCILYFYDTTRSHTRQWCSMAGCGNRMKVAAFYRKHGR